MNDIGTRITGFMPTDYEDCLYRKGVADRMNARAEDATDEEIENKLNL